MFMKKKKEEKSDKKKIRRFDFYVFECLTKNLSLYIYTINNPTKESR